MTTPLEDELVLRIRERGPLPFAAYMSLALYHPRHGYYGGDRPRVGFDGHFLTSPELDPGFGELWSRAFEEVWRSCGAPDEFRIVEVGPGEGAFAAAVMSSVGAELARCLTYVLVERSPAARQRQQERLGDLNVEWRPDISDVEPADAGCVFANEVLDNLPVHVVEMRGGELLEVCVDAADGRLQETLRPPTNPELTDVVRGWHLELEEGHRLEVPLSTTAFVARMGASLQRGALVFVDYGITTDELSTRPGGTLVCYSASGADDRPLERPGEKDITCHANWTVVADACVRAGMTPAGPVSQREVLRRLGLEALHGRLADQHRVALEEKKGADAVRALSRRQALGAIADPGGLGGLQVMSATKGIPPLEFTTG